MDFVQGILRAIACLHCAFFAFESTMFSAGESLSLEQRSDQTYFNPIPHNSCQSVAIVNCRISMLYFSVSEDISLHKSIASSGLGPLHMMS